MIGYMALFVSRFFFFFWFIWENLDGGFDVYCGMTFQLLFINCPVVWRLW